MKNMTTLEILSAALRAVYDAEMADDSEPTGVPMYRGLATDPDLPLLPGAVPSGITWTADRGNWMWDGVLAALRAQGVDTGKAVTDADADGEDASLQAAYDRGVSAGRTDVFAALASWVGFQRNAAPIAAILVPGEPVGS